MLITYLFSLQAKADEIAKLMNENEHLKSVIEDLKVYNVFLLPCSLYQVSIY